MDAIYYDDPFSPESCELYMQQGQRWPDGEWNRSRHFYDIPGDEFPVQTSLGASGLAANVQVDLSPSTVDLVEGTKRDLLKGIDVLSKEVGAAVRLATVGLVIAAGIGAAAFLMKK